MSNSVVLAAAPFQKQTLEALEFRVVHLGVALKSPVKARRDGEICLGVSWENRAAPWKTK
jgi:hypothetical protein